MVPGTFDMGLLAREEDGMPRGGARPNAGRPRKSARTQRVWVRIRPQLYREIEQLASAQGREVGQLLSIFVETGMMVWADDANQIQPLIVD